ncbi:MAG: hypothetical protein Q7R32_06365 [Dehalococcoidia bacterium]|nr:hypothetical protein [Dehalococcoidia bacterium]
MLVGLLTACDPGIELKIVNDTDSPLCWYETERDVGDPEWCNEIEANDAVSWSTICTMDQPKAVILTVGISGEPFYEKEATCGEWKDAGATVTVEQRDGDR